MNDPKNEPDRLVWGKRETGMFHDIKSAGLVGPWQGMCDRTVKMFEFEFDSNVKADVDEAVALAEHIEVLAIRRIHSRRASFQEDYDYRKGRGNHGRLDR